MVSVTFSPAHGTHNVTRFGTIATYSLTGIDVRGAVVSVQLIGRSGSLGGLARTVSNWTSPHPPPVQDGPFQYELNTQNGLKMDSNGYVQGPFGEYNRLDFSAAWTENGVAHSQNWTIYTEDVSFPVVTSQNPADFASGVANNVHINFNIADNDTTRVFPPPAGPVVGNEGGSGTQLSSFNATIQQNGGAVEDMIVGGILQPGFVTGSSISGLPDPLPGDDRPTSQQRTVSIKRSTVWAPGQYRVRVSVTDHDITNPKTTTASWAFTVGPTIWVYPPETPDGAEAYEAMAVLTEIPPEPPVPPVAMGFAELSLGVPSDAAAGRNRSNRYGLFTEASDGRFNK